MIECLKTITFVFSRLIKLCPRKFFHFICKKIWRYYDRPLPCESKIVKVHRLKHSTILHCGGRYCICALPFKIGWVIFVVHFQGLKTSFLVLIFVLVGWPASRTHSPSLLLWLLFER